MNFVWFLLSIILFYIFYWYFLSLIIFLPSMSVTIFIGYLIKNFEKKWAKILIIPASALVFILGTFLPCAIFGMGIGVTVLRFVGEATYPIIYFLIAGIGAFTISAPSGETSFSGMLISLITYITTVTISEFALFSGITIDFLFDLFFVLAIGFLLLGILFFIITFLKEKFSKLFGGLL